MTEIDGAAAWPQSEGHAEKMGALARVAGGMSHDVGDLVEAAASSVRDALMHVPQATAAHDELEHAVSTLQRAGTIARQLSALAEPDRVSESERRNLADTVRALLPLVSRLAGAQVRVVAECGDDTPWVDAGPGQVEHVLFHLVVNARDAMPRGGVLTLTVRTERLAQARRHRYGVLEAGEWGVLSVTDTGAGMSDRVLACLFEPFFTTKPAGLGSGLGLATVYGIARQLGGQVCVETTEGVGSTLALWLPMLPAAASVTPVPVGDAAVLVVDDDSWVRAATARLLRRAGYGVLEASDGEEALALLSDVAGRCVRVVLSDVVMPGMSGTVLAAEVAVRRPDVRVVLASGYGPEGGAAAEATGRPWLCKPYSGEELLAAVAG